MQAVERRRFLQFLAASPALASAGMTSVLAEETLEAHELAEHLIASPDDALDVFDFHTAAKRALPSSHYGYLATGTDGNETLAANREGFRNVYLRAMRMVDTREISLQTELLGHALESPVVLAPVGSQKAFHDDAELATAAAARARNHLQILSNVTSTSIEDVIATRGEPVWFQLYPTDQWPVARGMLQRAERAGARVVVLTVDLNAGSNRVMLGQYSRADSRDCMACHSGGFDQWINAKPMYAGAKLTEANLDTPGMTWAYLDRIRSATSMKIVVKGIVTAEDAAAAVDSGADAVYVSNHGGRAEASGWGAIESLPEVVAAIDGTVPVMVDSGFRRGTDIFKALALGADAVAVGRPYIWGLAAFGQAGVEKVLEMLDAELRMVMAQIGATTIEEIGSQHVGHRS
ncbi:MAG: alpha-hydroxy acid oxidase [Woeseiaceae bacterium]|nr:alpha-hydroxy acid oxidase [Woeseiaceae bacterium]